MVFFSESSCRGPNTPRSFGYWSLIDLSRLQTGQRNVAPSELVQPKDRVISRQQIGGDKSGIRSRIAAHLTKSVWSGQWTARATSSNVTGSWRDGKTNAGTCYANKKFHPYSKLRTIIESLLHIWMITGDCEHTWAKCGSYDRVKLLFRLACGVTLLHATKARLTDRWHRFFNLTQFPLNLFTSPESISELRSIFLIALHLRCQFPLKACSLHVSWALRRSQKRKSLKKHQVHWIWQDSMEQSAEFQFSYKFQWSGNWVARNSRHDLHSTLVLIHYNSYVHWLPECGWSK